MPRLIVSGTASDAHTWNLVVLELFAREHGWSVRNLGPCTPDELLLETCLEHRPDLLVLSTINGHGWLDGLRTIRRLRDLDGLADLIVVIGGMPGPGTDKVQCGQTLLNAGFDEVFFDGAPSLSRFGDYLDSLARSRRPIPRSGHRPTKTPTTRH